MARVHASRLHASRAITVFAALALLLALVIPIGADDVTEVFLEGDAGDIAQAGPAASSDLWFVELKSGPTADGTSLATVRAEKDAFRGNAKKAKLNYSERFAFDTLWNGLAIKIDPAQVSTLRRIDGVAAIYPIETISLPSASTDGDNGTDLATAVQQTGADIAQSTLGLSGAGVKVAVMDTGVDYHHPDLGGCFGPDCRVTTGWDFVGSAFAGPASTPVPDNDPDDCNGHGTHVAGIVGANGGVRGVAPGVTFGAYRVFGCEGSTTTDIMIAAMERALADGMHVLNMSIGSAFQTWTKYPTAAASDRLVNKGVVVVASIGNSGASGVYSAGAPGVGKKVIGVASFDNTRVSQTAFAVSPDGRLVGYNNATGAPAAPVSGTLVMSKTGTPTTTDDGCAPLGAGHEGKAVLIRRGTCGFHQKALNAQNAGAAAVVLYNNTTGALNPTVAGTPAITIPVVAITAADGTLINNRIAAGETTLTWTSQSVSAPSATGNLISSFSSWGLTAELMLKPDIGAPGGNIYSTYPIEKGSYANISGTSMASPHVAGGVALLLQARPGTNANDVRDILQNSADPKNWSGNPSLGFLDATHRQGAGMLDIDDAILATTSITPGKIALGESVSPAPVNTITIKNRGASEVTYALSHTGAIATGGNTNPPLSFFNAPATVTFTQAGIAVTSVTVPAGGSATVDVAISENAGLAARSQYGGYLTFTGGGQTFRVPYAGFKGDYQTLVAVGPSTCPVALPAIGDKGPSSFCSAAAPVPFKLPATDLTFTLADGDVPYIVFHFDHQVRRLRIEAFDAAGNIAGLIGDFDYLGRNSAAGYGWVTWDGEVTKGNRVITLPDGQYTIKLSVLKALGDPADPAHTETRTLPAITLDRP